MCEQKMRRDEQAPLQWSHEKTPLCSLCPLWLLHSCVQKSQTFPKFPNPYIVTAQTQQLLLRISQILKILKFVVS